MKPRLPLLLATIAAVTLTALTGASSATASNYCEYEDDTPPDITSYSPTSVIVGLSPAARTFSVHADDECPIDSWSVYSSSLLFYVYDSNRTEVFDPWSNRDAGTHSVAVSASDTAYNTSNEVFTFQLRRNTYVSNFNAYPESGGRTKTVVGNLKRADWEADEYRGYAGRTIHIQFKPTGGTYRYLASTTTSRTGRFQRTVTIPSSGTLRAVFDGNSASGPAKGRGDSIRR